MYMVEIETSTYHDGLGPDPMYLFEAVERYGVQLAFEELGMEGVHVSFETGDIDLSTVLCLHFVPEMKHRSETN